jgi:hypothetical protein
VIGLCCCAKVGSRALLRLRAHGKISLLCGSEQTYNTQH